MPGYANWEGTAPYLYIVSPVGPYQTIQSAIDAVVAEATQPQTIYIFPGTYTENLTLYDGVNLLGSNEMEVYIDGVHTPPVAGSIQFDSIKFISATDVILDAGANACDIKFYNCVFDLTASGYVLNMDIATGYFVIESCTEYAGSVDNGIIYNTGGAVLDILDSSIGTGTTGATISGVTRLNNNRIYCPLSFVNGATARFDSDVIDGMITLNNNSTTYIYNSSLVSTGGLACITTSLVGDTVVLSNTAIDTVAADAIAGAAGTIEVGEGVFINDDSIAATLTVTHTTNLRASNVRIHGIETLPDTNAAGTEGIIYFDADTFIHKMGDRNTFVGREAGNLALTVLSATDETGLGFEALHDITSGCNNTAVGAYALTDATTSDNNVAVGYAALATLTTAAVTGSNVAVGSNSMVAATTGQYNTSVGAASLATTTGSNNIALGYSAANALVAAESSNIIIGSPGVIGDGNTIRIGVDGAGVGQQSSNYQAGIYQAASGATKEVVWIDSNFKLSSSNIGITQWVTATISLTAAVNTGYVVDIAIPGLLTITLPATSQLGDIIEITGLSAGGWTIAQADAADIIHYGNQSSTLGVGGSISSTHRYDSIKLVCYTDHKWKVLSSVGVLLVV